MSNELKIYEVHNRDTGKKQLSVATNAEDACKLIGWQIGDCFVSEQKPKRRPMSHPEPRTLYKIPCQVCPFQYAECRKPPRKQCPVQPNAPELNDWLKQACEAHKCDYYGQELSNNDYHLGQKWLPIEQAIEELSHHH